MKKFVVSWLLMWALSYLVVAVVAPGVGGPPVWLDIVEYLGTGAALMAATLIIGYYPGESVKVIARAALVVLAVISVYSGIGSFAGVFIWVVPYADKAVTQVSMAFLDLVGAAAMIYLALDEK